MVCGIDFLFWFTVFKIDSLYKNKIHSSFFLLFHWPQSSYFLRRGLNHIARNKTFLGWWCSGSFTGYQTQASSESFHVQLFSYFTDHKVHIFWGGDWTIFPRTKLSLSDDVQEVSLDFKLQLPRKVFTCSVFLYFTDHKVPISPRTKLSLGDEVQKVSLYIKLKLGRKVFTCSLSHGDELAEDDQTNTGSPPQSNTSPGKRVGDRLSSAAVNARSGGVIRGCGCL